MFKDLFVKLQAIHNAQSGDLRLQEMAERQANQLLCTLDQLFPKVSPHHIMMADKNACLPATKGFSDPSPRIVEMTGNTTQIDFEVPGEKAIIVRTSDQVFSHVSYPQYQNRLSVTALSDGILIVRDELELGLDHCVFLGAIKLTKDDRRIACWAVKPQLSFSVNGTRVTDNRPVDVSAGEPVVINAAAGFNVCNYSNNLVYQSQNDTERRFSVAHEGKASVTFYDGHVRRTIHLQIVTPPLKETLVENPFYTTPRIVGLNPGRTTQLEFMTLQEKAIIVKTPHRGYSLSHPAGEPRITVTALADGLLVARKHEEVREYEKTSGVTCSFLGAIELQDGHRISCWGVEHRQVVATKPPEVLPCPDDVIYTGSVFTKPEGTVAIQSKWEQYAKKLGQP